MINSSKSYKADTKKQILHMIILLAISIPLIFYCINNIVEYNKKLGIYDNNVSQISL